MESPRVRFAPSPTGSLHIGNARTALFNWLVAKHYRGSFILRLEDTDRVRSTSESEHALLEDLEWLGLTWEEGPGTGGRHAPYRQSERLDKYRFYSEWLVQNGYAYPCFCTDGELAARKEKRRREGLSTHYDGRCLTLSTGDRQSLIEKGRRPALRFHVTGDNVLLKDLVKGEIHLPLSMVGDFVIIRSDGFPTYNFAVVIDDALMEITHVLRGEDHLSNTLRQVLLYRALSFPQPHFGHFGLITGFGGEKLSKRRNSGSTPVNFISQLRREGYLSEAVLNYLALLGWAHPEDREILSVSELIDYFTLENIAEGPSAFDPTKLLWINGQHMRSRNIERLTAQAIPYLRDAGYDIAAYDASRLERIVQIGIRYAQRLSDIPEAVDIFFRDRVTISSPDSRAILKDPSSRRIFAEFLQQLDRAEREGGDDARKGRREIVIQAMKKAGKKQKVGGKPLWKAFRVALTGNLEGPELQDIIDVFDLEKIRKLVESALSIE
jgi:nondiscriminating glutamyl-tRNA synthetase